MVNTEAIGRDMLRVLKLVHKTLRLAQPAYAEMRKKLGELPMEYLDDDVADDLYEMIALAEKAGIVVAEPEEGNGCFSCEGQYEVLFATE